MKNNTIGYYHLRKSIDALELDFHSRINKMREVVAELEAINDGKNQTSLNFLDTNLTYRDIERFIIEDRKFKTYNEFDIWARRVKPEIVCAACFTATGNTYGYSTIKEVAQKCLTNPSIEVLK